MDSTTRHDSGSARPLWTAVAASFVSVTGTAMTAIAVPLLVLGVTGSGRDAGLVAFFELAPYLLAQFFGGPLVDRLGFRRVAVVGNTVAGALVCLVPWLFLTAVPQLWVLCVLLAIAGLARGGADLGSGALVPVLAAAGAVQMSRASGWNNTAQRAGLVIGGLLGGLLLTVASPSVVILGDGLSFLAAASMFASIRSVGVRDSSAAPGRADDGDNYRTRLRAGFAFIGREPLVRALVLVSASTNLFAAALSGVLLQAWSLDRQVAAGALGVIFAALGLGQVAGSVIAATWGSRLPRFRMFVIGFLVGGPPMFLAPALSGVPLVVGAIVLIGGVALGMVNPVLGAVYYERIPVPLLARVLGTIRATAWAGVAIGPLLGGILLSQVGVTPTLLICGIGYTALALMPLVVPVFRGLAQVGAVDTAPTDDHVADPAPAPAPAPAAAEDPTAPTADALAAPSDAGRVGPRDKQVGPGISAGPRLPWQRSAEPRPESTARSDRPARPVL
ncbi:MAG: MFS transporter [Nakamurella sp.]